MEITCLHCGFVLKDEDRYCPSCGVDNKAVVCNNCRRQIRSYGSCPYCGVKTEFKDLRTEDGKRLSISGLVGLLTETLAGHKVLINFFADVNDQIEKGAIYDRNQVINAFKRYILNWYDQSNVYLDPRGVDWDRLYDKGRMMWKFQEPGLVVAKEEDKGA